MLYPPGVVDWTNVGLSVAALTIALTAAVAAFVQGRVLRLLRGGVEENLTETKTVRTQTLEALDIHEILVTNRELSQQIRSLTRRYVSVTDLNDPLLLDLAAQGLNRLEDELRMQADGSFHITEDQFARADVFASELLDTTVAGDEFWASSLVNPEFWERAAAYLERHREKQGKVAMRRVFVFESRDAYEDETARAQMRIQTESGVDVMCLIRPTADVKDLVLVRKRLPSGELEDQYAAQFTVRDNKTISAIDIWSSPGGQYRRVRDVRHRLQFWFDSAEHFPLKKVRKPTRQVASLSRSGRGVRRKRA